MNFDQMASLETLRRLTDADAAAEALAALAAEEMRLDDALEAMLTTRTGIAERVADLAAQRYN